MAHVRIEKPAPRVSAIVLDRPERMNSMALPTHQKAGAYFPG